MGGYERSVLCAQCTLVKDSVKIISMHALYDKYLCVVFVHVLESRHTLSLSYYY